MLALSSTAVIADGPAPDLASEVAALRARVEQQERQINDLERDKGSTWLSERRTEEVKLLVREVLSDASMRASLLDAPVVAGYDNGFFITTEDGKYLLKTNLETQFRYIFSSIDNEVPTDDDYENGFQVRRARVAFSGNFIDPKFTYRFRIAYDRGTGNLQFDDAWSKYKISDSLAVQFGQFKPQFLREENVGGFKQLAVERTYVADYFTIDYTQGVELSWIASEKFNLYAAVHDGSYGLNTEYSTDRTNIAVNGRAEALLVGSNWRQFQDFTSWGQDALGVLVGAAVGYEVGEDGPGNTPVADVIKYSADISAELGGANFFAGFYGQYFDDKGAPGTLTNLDDANQVAFVVQGGIFVIPDKLELFGRYEWIDFDNIYYRNNGSGAALQTGSVNIPEDDLSIVTVGGNYYFNRHSLKLTVDVLYALDPAPVANTGAGILANGGGVAPFLANTTEDDQISLRAQIQFTF